MSNVTAANTSSQQQLRQLAERTVARADYTLSVYMEIDLTASIEVFAHSPINENTWTEVVIRDIHSKPDVLSRLRNAISSSDPSELFEFVRSATGIDERLIEECVSEYQQDSAEVLEDVALCLSKVNRKSVAKAYVHCRESETSIGECPVQLAS